MRPLPMMPLGSHGSCDSPRDAQTGSTWTSSYRDPSPPPRNVQMCSLCSKLVVSLCSKLVVGMSSYN